MRNQKPLYATRVTAKVFPLFKLTLVEDSSVHTHANSFTDKVFESAPQSFSTVER